MPIVAWSCYRSNVCQAARQKLHHHKATSGMLQTYISTVLNFNGRNDLLLWNDNDLDELFLFLFLLIVYHAFALFQGFPCKKRLCGEIPHEEAVFSLRTLTLVVCNYIHLMLGLIPPFNAMNNMLVLMT